jgi:hypothetical protein
LIGRRSPSEVFGAVRFSDSDWLLARLRPSVAIGLAALASFKPARRRRFVEIVSG